MAEQRAEPGGLAPGSVRSTSALAPLGCNPDERHGRAGGFLLTYRLQGLAQSLAGNRGSVTACEHMNE